jgi:hypothetical protein
MSVQLQELAARLRISALSNARAQGWLDAEAGELYRCAQVCGDDAQMRSEYDAGWRSAEWEKAMELASDPYCHVAMKGVFVTLRDGVISDGRMVVKPGVAQ